MGKYVDLDVLYFIYNYYQSSTFNKFLRNLTTPRVQNMSKNFEDLGRELKKGTILFAGNLKKRLCIMKLLEQAKVNLEDELMVIAILTIHLLCNKYEYKIPKILMY